MDLSSENSWWNVGGLWQDRDLKRVRVSPIHYRPTPFTLEDASSEGIFTLRGPRRSGKTVALKLLIAELLEKQSWDPHSIVWDNWEILRTLAQAEDRLRVIASRKPRPRLLVVDEVTALIGWQKVIKKLRDNGVLDGITIILTGSSAHDLKAGAERMAGRRGSSNRPDRILLPMPFREFKQQWLRHDPKQAEQGELVRRFLEIGGFPFRVEEDLKRAIDGKAVDPEVSYSVFDDVFFYEITRRRLDRAVATELVGRLATAGTSAMSYEGLMKPLSIAKDTGRKYLEALSNSFLLVNYSSFDTARGRVAPKKDRKFGWIDPALGRLAHWLQVGPLASEDQLAEWTVGVELLRRFETRLWEGLGAPRCVFTWKSSSGNEVDYLVVDRSRNIREPVEVKWQRSISPWDAQVMEKAFGKGTLVTSGHDGRSGKVLWTSLSGFLLSSQ